MKEYLKKKITEIIVVIYAVTAFFTPFHTVYAAEPDKARTGSSGKNEAEVSTDDPGDAPVVVEKVSQDETEIPSDIPVKNPVNANGDAGDEEAASGNGVPSVFGREAGDSLSGDSEEQASAAPNGPVLKNLMITLYRYDAPDFIHSRQEYTGFQSYRYNAKTDKEVPFSEKYVADFREIKGRVSELAINFYPDTDQTEYEIEELDPETLEVLSTTGRVDYSRFIFKTFGLFRLHMYPLYEVGDADEEDIMYYFYSTGIDNVPPVVNAEFTLNGNGHTDKNGKMRYAGGKITVNASDEHTALDEKPYMLDYPDGEWGTENVIEKASAQTYTIGVRDIKNNITVVSVDAACIDEEPPELKETKIDDSVLFNGYALEEDIEIIADDETELAGRYFSRNSTDWLDKSIISVSCNGSYDFYLRDVFRNTVKKTLEVDNIDREPPVIRCLDTPDVNVNGYSYSHTLKINAEDEKAGFGERPYSYDGGKTWVSGNSITVRDNGNYELCARDGLGNTCEKLRIEVDDIDNMLPKIDSLSENRKDLAGIYAPFSQICVSASDEKSGLRGNYVSFDDGETWTKENVMKVYKDGVYHIKIRDGVGNITASRINIRNIDSAVPKCEITGNPANLTKNKAVLKLKLRDELSGLKSVYVENSKAGVKKAIKDYDPDGRGIGANSDSVDVDITSNGEYIFTVTDMCGNVGTEKVTVSKIIKPSPTPQKEDPEEDSDKNPEKDTEKKPDKKDEDNDQGKNAVVIGNGSSNSDRNKKDSTITVKSAGQSTVSESESVKITASSNRYRSEDLFEDGETEEEVSENGLTDDEDTDETYPEDFSSEFYDTELPEYRSSNDPRELEALPNPDEVETVEEHSHAAVIACTVFAIVLGLSALTFYLLIKKGIIKKPDFLGDPGGNE